MNLSSCSDVCLRGHYSIIRFGSWDTVLAGVAVAGGLRAKYDVGI